MVSTLDSYSYELPDSFIAHEPVSPRDAAKLLIYSRDDKKIEHAVFSDLASFLPANSLLVFNNTKVMPARIIAQKETGGAVEFLVTDIGDSEFKALANRKLAISQQLRLPDSTRVTVEKNPGHAYRFSVSATKEKLRTILEEYGTTPLPPYIHTTLSEDEARKEYQSVFAQLDGSSAAPTASLHFTEELIETLRASGIDVAYITLHVGLGTFAPVRDEHITKGELHSEYYEISKTAARVINAAKQNGRKIIAVGTTTVRALESAFHNGDLRQGSGETRLFIQPGYSFNVIDGMITNFHVPRSSLMMLVSAFMGRDELLRCYEAAQVNNYRFFSFGDGMLIY